MKDNYTGDWREKELARLAKRLAWRMRISRSLKKTLAKGKKK
jgi:hypothetical protein